jgi:hypothetical protein
MKCPPLLTKSSVPANPLSKSPSWVTERDVLREFGDRKTRAILAIFLARRSAKNQEFFVHPSIAALHGLNSSDLNWTLDKLEGAVVETLESRNGKYRMLRLLPRFEEMETECATRDLGRGRRFRKAAPAEEMVIFDKNALLERLSVSPCEPAAEVLLTLREIASEPRGSI